MTPEENARMAFEKNRKAQIEQKKVISDLKSRIERLEELVSVLLENAGHEPVKTAENVEDIDVSEAVETVETTEESETESAEASTTEEETEDEI